MDGRVIYFNQARDKLTKLQLRVALPFFETKIHCKTDKKKVDAII